MGKRQTLITLLCWWWVNTDTVFLACECREGRCSVLTTASNIFLCTVGAWLMLKTNQREDGQINCSPLTELLAVKPPRPWPWPIYSALPQELPWVLSPPNPHPWVISGSSKSLGCLPVHGDMGVGGLNTRIITVVVTGDGTPPAWWQVLAGAE